MTGGNTTGSFLRVQGICLGKRGLGFGGSPEQGEHGEEQLS